MISSPMQASLRMQAVQSPIIPDIANLVANTKGAISLGQGVVFYQPPESIFKAIDNAMQEPQNQLYGPVAGMPELVDAIQLKLLSDNSVDVSDTHRIVVTAGANMAFLNALYAICDPGDEVILLTPYYFNHEMAINMVGCKVRTVATDNNYQPILADIEAAINTKTRAIVTISPNNPTGVVYPEKTLRAINQLCQSRDLYHISDEAYEYFLFNDAKHYSPASDKAACKHTISLFSLSKSYGFASWRIGYMLVPEQLYDAVIKVQDTNLICPAIISQIAATEILTNNKDHYQNKIPKIAINRELCLDALKTLDGHCRISSAEGAFYLYLDLPGDIPSMTLASRLIKEHGVAGIPGATFGHSHSCCLRISYGALEEAAMSTAIARLVRGLKQILL